MKTLIKQSLIVALMTATLTSYAASVEPLVKVVGDESKVFTLIWSEVNLRQAHVFIKDKNGVVLYEEDLNAEANFQRRFDLRALPKGDYILEVENQTMLKIMPFQVKRSDIQFSKGEEKLIFKPYLRARGMEVDVMLMADSGKSTKVQIHDAAGTLLHTERVPAGESIEKIFDFSNHQSGNFTFRFFRGGRTFSQNIELTK